MVSENTHTILIYQGIINASIISDLLDDLDKECLKLNISDASRKKAFNIAVEIFQNLYHYTRDLNVDNKASNEIRSIEIRVEADSTYLYLGSRNSLKNTDIEALKKKINQVNSLSNEELHQLYKSVLGNEEFSEKGGAGLGLIDMRKRSGFDLEYSIIPQDDFLSIYSLTVKVEK